ncbi:MAG: hypothetical protein FH753_01975 [Firmicutes bacterium]|nr:hypothetical protein [Bacillota bacterium]
MSIIIKFLFRNIKENKMRTFLILFSITISTGLFFASMAISDTVTEMYAKQLMKNFGSSEIMIYPNKDSPSSFFRTNKAKKHNENMEYIIATLNGNGLYKISKDENVKVDLKGYILKDLEKMNPIKIKEGYDLKSFNGKKL